MKKSIVILCASICSFNDAESISFFSKFDLWKKNKEENVTHEQTLAPNSRISVENSKGTISIKTWNKPKLLIEATKKGSEEEIRLTKIETLYTKEGASIKTVPLKPDRQCFIDYTLIIPQDAVLTLVQTNKGEIFIKNVSTPVKAHAECGTINFQNVTNSLQASTKYGSISIHAKKLKPASKIVAIAEKGSIKLELPTEIDATLYAKTDKGTVTSDHAITLEPRKLRICQASLAELKRDVRGSLGHGGQTVIKLHTSRGNVRVLEA